jgi:hypothetical protein
LSHRTPFIPAARHLISGSKADPALKSAALTLARRNCMSQQDRIEALKEKHASLERAIDEESHRPLPDQAAIYDLKRQKLRIKDEIVQLERQ